MNGTHAQLAVEPRRDCPLREITATYDIRGFRPARGTTPSQIVVETRDVTTLDDEPACEPVVATERFVVCRLVPDADRPPECGLCGPERCLAEGFEHLPVQPYDLSWADNRLLVTIAATDAETIQACLDRLAETTASASVETMSTNTAEDEATTVLVDLDVLTDRQREIAELAVERGYYGSDGSSAAELAEQLDISKATLSEHLRTVRSKLGQQIFGTS